MTWYIEILLLLLLLLLLLFLKNEDILCLMYNEKQNHIPTRTDPEF